MRDQFAISHAEASAEAEAGARAIVVAVNVYAGYADFIVVQQGVMKVGDRVEARAFLAPSVCQKFSKCVSKPSLALRSSLRRGEILAPNVSLKVLKLTEE